MVARPGDGERRQSVLRFHATPADSFTWQRESDGCPGIAEEIRISPRTVGSHVEHMLAKLGATRRAEIAAWVTTLDAGERAAVAR